MIKLQIVIIKLLQILLTQTKLILVSLRPFLICLMTTTKVNLVWNPWKEVPIYSQLIPITHNKY